MELPLLVGGATTSRQHTAVRVAPEYTNPTIHVLDASRVAGVVGQLLDPTRREELDRSNRVDQDRLRALHAERERKPLLPIRAARERRAGIVWHAEELVAPSFTGSRLVAPTIAELRRYIDWTFFLHAWELKGRVPGDPRRSGAWACRPRARSRSRRRSSIGSRATAGCGPRVSMGSGPRSHRATTSCSKADVRFPMLRQQADHGDSRPNRSLADFVAPEETGLTRSCWSIRNLGSWRRGGCGGVRARRRRLQLDHGEGACRQARRGRRRVAARADATRVVRPGRAALGRGAQSASASRGSGPRSGTPPARITPRSHVSSPCWRPAGSAWS